MSLPSSLDSNALEVTVSELSGALKRMVEDQFGSVRLRGEISGYRGPHGSGHAYFSLKDANARIDAVAWRPTVARLKPHLQEGLEVIATGRLTTFPGKSSYQIIIEALEPAGIGALMALLEERRKRLSEEGLFANERKRPIPFLPRSIGIITSPTGAVIRDMLHVLEERFRRHILLWPVRVQGDTAAEEISAAIEGFNRLPVEGPLQRPDLLIIARGGGSLEDLWAFNDERMIRTAAASMIPVISAVGHETDWTLLDHVADLRAPTPTAAAEKAVPVQRDLIAALADLHRRLQGASLRAGERRRTDLRALARALPDACDLFASKQQQLDRQSDRLRAFLNTAIDNRRITLERALRRLAQQSPQALLARISEKTRQLAVRLSQAGTRRLTQAGEHLQTLLRRLSTVRQNEIRSHRGRQTMAMSQIKVLALRLRQASQSQMLRRAEALSALAHRNRALSYQSVLERGFAVIRDQRGQMIRQADVAQKAHHLTIQFADGRIDAQTFGAASAPIAAGSKKPKAKKQSGQADLF